MNSNQQKTPPDPLLQPLTIKHLTLRNRIMSTSHADGLGEWFAAAVSRG